MRTILMVALAFVCVCAADAADIEGVKKLPRGVHDITYDKGCISTLVVVGKASVPRSLRNNKELDQRRFCEKARSLAEMEFVRFLTTKCNWGKKANGRHVVFEETTSEKTNVVMVVMSRQAKERLAQNCFSMDVEMLWSGMNDHGEFMWVGEWDAECLPCILDVADQCSAEFSECSRSKACKCDIEFSSRSAPAQSRESGVKKCDAIASDGDFF